MASMFTRIAARTARLMGSLGRQVKEYHHHASLRTSIYTPILLSPLLWSKNVHTQPTTLPCRASHTSAIGLGHRNHGPSVLWEQSIGSATENNGRLEVILGCMFSGKTTELLRRLKVYEMAGMKTLLVKSDKDDRYNGTAIVTTHDGVSREGIAVRKLMSLVHPDPSKGHAVDPSIFQAAQVIAIDEAQFFPDIVEFCDTVVSQGKLVIACGLDGDYRREGFQQVLSLIPKSESVHKLSAVCGVCHNPASFSHRHVAQEGVELVGGSEMYQAVCRPCYDQLEQEKHSK